MNANTSDSRGNPVLRVAVVGAGPSGLVALKTLRAAGLDAHCYESGARVGGQWAMDNPGGHAGAYATLRTNTNRSMSRYSDFAFPPEYPDYPSHDLMAAWFEEYARRFDLFPHIHLSTRVTRAIGNDRIGYRLHTDRTHLPEAFDAVVAATGNLWDAVVPDFIRSYEGPWLHSHDYRDPARPMSFAGRRVLVVGLGNSGCEIAVDLSECAEVLLSARSGQNILPRIGAGGRSPPHPADSNAPPFTSLPRPLRDTAFRWLFPIMMNQMRKRLPDPVKFGLPPAPRDPFLKRAIVNDHLFDRLSNGRIKIRPDVRSIAGRKVSFADGGCDEIDAIVLATGYRFTLPWVDPAIVGTEDLEGLRLYQGIMHPQHNRFFVVGVLRALCSIWPYSEQQARWIAALLTGKFELPSPSRLAKLAYPILRGRLLNCQFRAADLRREAGLP